MCDSKCDLEPGVKAEEAFLSIRAQSSPKGDTRDKITALYQRLM